MNKTSGIPTLHKHRRYRSRLEARWAVMFDLLGWEYEYEPFDCDGWIPDFILIGKQPTLVEVKPITSFDPRVADKMLRACPKTRIQYYDEYDLSEMPRHDLLLVGLRPGKILERPSLGWLCERCSDEWAAAPFGRWDAGDGTIGFCHENGRYYDRISGGYHGGCWGDSVTFDEINRLWAEAGNRVQWRAP